MTSTLRLLLLLLLQLTHSSQEKEESLVTKPFLTSSRFVDTPSRRWKELNYQLYCSANFRQVLNRDFYLFSQASYGCLVLQWNFLLIFCVYSFLFTYLVLGYGWIFYASRKDLHMLDNISREKIFLFSLGVNPVLILCVRSCIFSFTYAGEHASHSSSVVYPDP